jgi:hypothetical protein
VIEVPNGAGGVTIDLVTLATAPDATLNPDRIKGLIIESDVDNISNITVEPGAADPWLGLLQTATSQLRLLPGSVLGFATRAVGWQVTAGSKTLKLSHGGVVSQYVKISIIANTV